MRLTKSKQTRRKKSCTVFIVIKLHSTLIVHPFKQSTTAPSKPPSCMGLFRLVYCEEEAGTKVLPGLKKGTMIWLSRSQRAEGFEPIREYWKTERSEDFNWAQRRHRKRVEGTHWCQGTGIRSSLWREEKENGDKGLMPCARNWDEWPSPGVSPETAYWVSQLHSLGISMATENHILEK